MHGVPPPPPSIQDMPAGARLFAGLGMSTITPDLDFETYSEAAQHWNGSTWVGPTGAPKGKRGLNVCGAAVYAEHPSSEVLMMSYDLKDGTGKHHWRPGLPPPADLFAYLGTGGPIEAHNAMFERLFWELVCVARLGWPSVKPEQWRCSMAKARAMALPGALGKAGAVLNLPVQKDKEGERLVKKFCEPRKPSKADPRTRILTLWSPDYQAARAEYARRGIDCSRLTPAQVAEDHADTLAFQSYNITDIAAEAELSARCPDLEGEELQWWQVDQASNRRGIAVDVPRLHDCAAIIREVQAKYGAELMMLTGIDSASKNEQIIGWLAGRGLRLDSLDDEAVTGALARTDLSPECRRVLEIRAACASASVKKVFAMLNSVSSDDRMRGLYVYHGARTGRDTGEGAQPTNLPSAGPNLYKCGGCGQHHAGPMCPFCSTVIKPDQEKREWNITAAEQCIEQIKRRSMQWLEWCYGDALHVIAGCLRAMYVSAPGKDFISTDYNSIEAVGLAELSGEAWRIETFNTHGKIYEKSAAMMFGVPFEEMMRVRGYSDTQLAMPGWWDQKPANPGAHHPLRKKGKVGELAFGYQGWIGSAHAFGMPGTDDEIKADILAWRAASPSIPELWGGQQRGRGWRAVAELYGVEGMAVKAIQNEGVECPVMRLDGTFSGITYLRRGSILYCRLPSGRNLHYHNPRLEPSDRDGWAISFEGWNTNPKNGPVGWIRMRTWGGRLVENINQAVCRDILRWACIRLEQRAYPVVMRTYDEIVCEIAEGFGSHEEFEGICTVPPPWAARWPIRAPDSWRAKRYRKG